MKNEHFQIDEFIKQLMSSKRFDELAEVIININSKSHEQSGNSKQLRFAKQTNFDNETNKMKNLR